MPDLHLNLFDEYWNQIVSGEKPFEFRLKNEKWQKRLVGRRYGFIRFKNESGEIHKVPYRGYEVQIITHKHFGSEPVEVYAIYTTEEKGKIL